ncbi:MAG TPA: hypothetical protein VN794_10625 [Methylomirabilota bacterium]|nr:hypothetical protein [Methylomirabilota bacterium]
MKAPVTRREFLADVGRGMVIATVGYGVARELCLAPAFAAEAVDALDFGPLEPLVRFMQETPADKLVPALAGKLKGGADLQRLVAAAALANARTFGGEDYVGFHTMMALAPALHMSRELPEALQPLPVFKVLYRNTNRIQEKAGARMKSCMPLNPGTCRAAAAPANQFAKRSTERMPRRPSAGLPPWRSSNLATPLTSCFTQCRTTPRCIVSSCLTVPGTCSG